MNETTNFFTLKTDRNIISSRKKGIERLFENFIWLGFMVYQQ